MDISHEQVAQLEPRAVMGHFSRLMQVPRPSGHPEPMVSLLREFARQHELEFSQDEVGNVVIRKAASAAEFEASRPIIIQAHIDMVSTAAPGVEHDWKRDPIQARLEGNWLKARGTTLGADNGLGVAAALAILEDPGMRHGPIYGLFTVEEETTMEGAELLAGPPFLPADAILVNVDSEEENAICVGCAGGSEVQLKMRMAQDAAGIAGPMKRLELKLRGLLGGHSGLNIQQQRANAIAVLADILETEVFPRLPSARLLNFTGGNAANAIPSYASAWIGFPAADDDEKELEAAIAEGLRRMRQIHVGPAAAANGEAPAEEAIPELGELATFGIDIRPLGDEEMSGPPIAPESSARFFALVRASPHGVWRLSKVIPGQTDTSVNLGIVTADVNQGAVLHFLIRSFSDLGCAEVSQAVEALAKLSGASFVPSFNAFRGWEPRADSLALRLTQDTFRELNPEAPAPHVYSIHAGLECGMLLRQYPAWDCVSIGPLITGAHSIDEQLSLETVAPFYAWLQAIVTSAAATTSGSEARA